MRKIHTLLVAILMLPLIAAAQGPTGAGAGSSSGSGSGSRTASSAISAPDFTQWELAVGYQYLRANLIGTPFNTDGLSTSLTRYFGRWVGVDGQMGAGFYGNTRTTTNPPNLGVHTLFVGAGPRLAYRGPSHIQPWVHFLIGLQDFRFTQSANGVLGYNKGLGGALDGGVDFPLVEHLAVRVEADEVETRFFSTYQRHFLVVTGLVFNF